MEAGPVADFLKSRGIDFKVLRHAKEAFTAEEAARERGVSLDALVKCVLLVDKARNYALVCLPGNARVDRHKVRALLGLGKLELASEDEISAQLKCTLGTLSPLSPALANVAMPIIFDTALVAKEKVNISSGDLMSGLEVETRSLIDLIKPLIGDVTQEELPR